MTRVLVVPAAGVGSRLRATVPKAVVPVAGRPMVRHLVDLYAPFVSAAVLVIRPEDERLVSRALDGSLVPIELVQQREPTGMLDALLLAGSAVARSAADLIWITWCDQIAILPATLERLARVTAEDAAAVVLPTMVRAAPYVHLVRDSSGRIVRVLHSREGDRLPPRGESDMGVFSLRRAAFLDQLPAYARETAAAGASTGERNFLPFLPWIADRARVVTFSGTHEVEAIGVNTAEDLDRVELFLRHAR